MTILGPDISSYERGLDLSALVSASFVIAKTTEGTFYTDSCYDGWRRQAAKLGRLFVFYHFLSGEDVREQVVHTKAAVGDVSLPGMLDVEPTGNYSPTLPQALAYIDAAHDAGLNLRLCYLPRWVWQNMGSPSLAGLRDRGVALVASSYPGGTGTPSSLYPGDNAAGWQAYGGLTPLLYQFTDKASDGGQSMDYNAARLTVPQLAAFLHSTPAPPTSGGSAVGTIPDSIARKWPDLAGDFPANAPFTDENALIWADAGARAAALFALQARDAINALASRISTPPAVDVNALAQALRPLLQSGADADAVATAVVAHLGAALRA